MDTFNSLKLATGSWSTPVLVRTYEGKTAQAAYQEEANLLGRYGYVPQTQTQDGGHVHVGRLLVTGGWSVLAGKKGIRSDSSMTVTFVKPQPIATGSTKPVTRTDIPGRPRSEQIVDSKGRTLYVCSKCRTRNTHVRQCGKCGWDIVW
jgi:hypothetical protein